MHKIAQYANVRHMQSVVYMYSEFYTSVNYVSCFVTFSYLFIEALWTPVGRRLTSWHLQTKTADRLPGEKKIISFLRVIALFIF